LNSRKLNEWQSLAANGGVLVGIGFLAMEIQLNTESNQFQAGSVIAQTHRWLSEKAIDGGVAELYMMNSRGEIEPETKELI